VNLISPNPHWFKSIKYFSIVPVRSKVEAVTVDPLLPEGRGAGSPVGRPSLIHAIPLFFGLAQSRFLTQNHFFVEIGNVFPKKPFDKK